MRKHYYILLALLLSTAVSAQDRYWVFFTDKDGVQFDPYTFFDGKAIERRIKHGLPLDDVSDYPLNTSYVQTVTNGVIIITGQSRWFNAVACEATEAQVAWLETLPFVRAVRGISGVQSQLAVADSVEQVSSKWTLLLAQTKRLGGDLFRAQDIDGKGVRIAIFDGGFPAVDLADEFKHLRDENRIVKTWDFVKEKEFVYAYNTHGTSVLSCMAGIHKGVPMGLATGAEYLLARVEKGSVRPLEENWVEAIEWADQHGVDIINSSMGYTTRNYFIEEMDGKTSLVARATNRAVRKGILFVNAAGNLGDGGWKIMITPADADSVLTVGGINPWTGFHNTFSSYGPTWDKRMKPNVCAFGDVVIRSKKGTSFAEGTSFASPMVAGFAACVLQHDSTLKAMELFKTIEQAADLYPYFDYAHGYGVPHARNVLNVRQAADTTFDLITKSGERYIKIRDNAFCTDSVTNWQEYVEQDGWENIHEVEKVGRGLLENLMIEEKVHQKMPCHLFYHIENSKGYLDKYFVVKVNSKEVLILSEVELEKGSTLRVHYNGFTNTYHF